jgi:hypothetical protein
MVETLSFRDEEFEALEIAAKSISICTNQILTL